MQPDSFTAGETGGDDQEGCGDDQGGDWIEELVCILAAGDISKREQILWGTTPKQTKPYIEYQKRQVTFREAVIGFLGAGQEQKSDRELYCEACKKTGKADCKNCQPEQIKRVNSEL